MSELGKGSESVLINAPIETVYNYIADFPRHPEWNANLDKLTQTSNGGLGVGTQYVTDEAPPETLPWIMRNVMFPMMSMMVGATGQTETEITVLQPHARIAWEAGLPIRNGYMMKSDWRVELKVQGNHTKVTQHYHFKPQITMAKMAVSDSQMSNVAKQTELNLEKLKTILEA